MAGIYVCSECEYPLFSSRVKYDHQSPWPAFTSPIKVDSLVKKPDPEREDGETALKVIIIDAGDWLAILDGQKQLCLLADFSLLTSHLHCRSFIYFLNPMLLS